MDGNDTYGGTFSDAPWSSSTQGKFESDAGKKVSIVHWGTSAPWTATFNSQLTAHQQVQSDGDLELVDMNSGGVPLRDIASGKYDSSIVTWVQQAAAWGHPFFLRWDWEMNGRWFSWGTTSTNQNTPADYVAAWRHLHDLAIQASATNINWVWCPNTDFRGSVPLEQVYPGDQYVDWTCMDAYNRGTSWQSFSTIFDATYNHLLQTAPTKPIMIGEMSSDEAGGSKAAWISDALTTQLPNSFPKIKAVVWMNWHICEAGICWPWQIESSAPAETAFASAMKNSYYAPGGSLGSLALGAKIQPLP